MMPCNRACSPLVKTSRLRGGREIGIPMDNPLFTIAWADVLSQIDLHAVDHARIAVLVAHDETCVECHNADQRPRCPMRLGLVAVMTRKGDGHE